MRRRWRAGLIAGGLALGLALLPYLLPMAINERLPFAVQGRVALNGAIRTITWRHLDLASVAWGPPGQETVEAEVVAADYSVSGLFKRRLAGLIVSGLTLHLASGPEGVTLRGFSRPKGAPVPSKQDWRLPVDVTRLDIRQGRIVIHGPDATTEVSFQLRLQAVADQPGQMRFSLDLLPEVQGRGLTLRGELDLARKTLQADLAGQLPLTAVARLASSLTGARLGPGLDGELRTSARIGLDEKGGSLTGVWVQSAAPGTREAVILAAPPASAAGGFSVGFALDGSWRLSAAGLVGGGTEFNTPGGRLRLATVSLGCQGQGRGQAGQVELALATEGITMMGGLEMAGITGSLHSPALFERRGGRVRLTFQQAKASGLTLTNGELALRLDGENRLFLDQAKAEWARGTVRATGLLMSPGSHDLALDLYADRLNLAQIFSQLGINQISGDGIVNGRIPLAYKEGKFSVAQGFISSSPGTGGALRLAAARDLITAGVPADAPQSAQLEFAAAALKDFIYNWLTISMDSEGDTMAVAMQLDGRPAQALPFRYDSRLGTFSRLAVAGEMGIDHPVRLDVNFRIPFNDLLVYAKGIKGLWDQQVQ